MRRKLYSIFLILIPFLYFAQDRTRDSLYRLIRSNVHDTVKTKAYRALSFNFESKGDHKDSVTPPIYTSLRISLQKKLNHEILNSHYALGQVFLKSSALDSALFHFNEALRFVKDKKRGYMDIVSGIANVHFLRGDYIRAYEYFLMFLKQAEISGTLKQKSRANGNVGVILKEQNKFDEAVPYFEKSIKYAQENNDDKGTYVGYVNIANVYFEKAKKTNDKELKLLALDYYNRARPLTRTKDFTMRSAIVMLYCNLGNIYSELKEFDKSIIEYSNAVKLIEEHGYIPQASLVYNNLAGLYVDLGDAKKAAEALKKAKETTEMADSFDSYAQLYQIYARYYELTGDYKNAYLSYRKHKTYSDSLFNTDNTEKRKELELNYEFDKKEAAAKAEQEKKEVLADQEKQRQRVILYAVLAGFSLMVILSFFIYRSYRLKKKANEIITLQKEEVEKAKHIIEKQKDLVEEKQKEILDSIHYAKRIQDALFTGETVLEKLQGGKERFFIYFNPKDIVSGDFYWATEHGDYIYLAACDSTGHGVPGAFMSLLNIGFMSEAINEYGITEPNLVFDYVRNRLINTISKEGQKDGFDGILLRMNKSGGELCYAAAYNKPLLIINGEIKELPCDKMPVGKGERSENFTLFRIEEKNAFLYLFTDGFADQFGGEKGKKFKYKSLYELLQKNSDLSCNEQKNKLQNTFDQWRGELEQVDDVLVIGLKI